MLSQTFFYGILSQTLLLHFCYFCWNFSPFLIKLGENQNVGPVVLFCFLLACISCIYIDILKKIYIYIKTHSLYNSYLYNLNTIDI